MKLFCFFILSLCAVSCFSANILGFFPAPSKSHLLIHLSVVDALVEKGHNVTVVTTLPVDIESKKFNHIRLNIAEEKTLSPELVKNITESSQGSLSAVGIGLKVIDFITGFGNETLNVPELKEFLKDPGNRFDLLLLGGAFSEFQLGLADHFNCPSILVWINVPTHNIHNLVGNPLELSYVPTFKLPDVQPLNFWARVKNFLIGNIEKVVFSYIDYKQKVYYDYNFPAEKYHSYEEALRNVSLVLAAHHFSQGPIRPNVPAMVEIGGVQINPNPKPLPKKLKDFIDKAGDDGVIYFNLGTNVVTTMLSKDKTDAIFKVFSGLKQKIVMKWEGEEIPTASNNIYFDKWLPQNAILNHPSVKLFIGHGGLGGLIEAKYHAVPIIGIPMFGDQFANVERAKQEGWAIDMEIKSLNEADLRETIMEMLQNPQYKERAKHYSSIYRDRQVSPRETALYWIEYVLRHHGAPHLQSPAVHMNTVEYYSLDVLALLAVILYAFFKLAAISVKFFVRKLFCWSRPHEKQKTS